MGMLTATRNRARAGHALPVLAALHVLPVQLVAHWHERAAAVQVAPASAPPQAQDSDTPMVVRPVPILLQADLRCMDCGRDEIRAATNESDVRHT
jgi:hypothetical protein